MRVEEKSDTLTVVRTNTKEIYLVGTAHVSEESAKEVANIIESVQPQHVAVELDAARYKTLTQGQDWSNLTVGKVLKEGKGLFMLANLALSSFQRSIGTSPPGIEMKAAVDAAKVLGVSYSFADRDVSITLKRTWRKSSLWNKMKLLSLLVGSVFSKEELSDKDVEALKERGALGGMMQELSKELPQVKEVLVDERDYYLAHNIYYAPSKKVVAVVGAAHTLGMVDKFRELDAAEHAMQDQDLVHAPLPAEPNVSPAEQSPAERASPAEPNVSSAEQSPAEPNVSSAEQSPAERASQKKLKEFEILPPVAPVGKMLKWLIPLGVVGIIAYGFISAGWEKGAEMFLYWVLANGILGGFGAIVALAHPVTIIVTVLAAPFTSLNPTIGVGFVSGALEGVLRKPRVLDFERLADDTKSLKGFYRNRFTHALIVFLFTSIGSAIGTFVALPWLLSMFGK